MEAKTGKELLGEIHDDEKRNRLNKYKHTDSLAVFCNNAMYIVGDEDGSDFHTGIDFLKWRLSALGVSALMEELDTTQFDFIKETLDAMENEWDKDYIKEILAECYHMEDLSLG
ncbi:hypothetical protein [Lactobacillus hominis]|uniref:hypothetical protein n=1 Tax=Lactobacillus hominis TaxID=1203033 RepID=UPI0023F3C977|nr:hypothetical protein [Lactobacillus hominis]